MRLARQITFAFLASAATVALCGELPQVKAPVLLRLVAPNYSDASSIVSDEKGTAIVTVNADGTVRNVEIKDASGTPLDIAIIKALRKWVFAPAMKSGEVVPSKILIPFSFDSQSGELSVDLGHYGGS